MEQTTGVLKMPSIVWFQQKMLLVGDLKATCRSLHGTGNSTARQTGFLIFTLRPEY